jgi:hypothetical protein
MRCLERCAASAGSGRVRIHEVKTGAGQTIAKIEGSALQIGRAVLIDEKLDAVLFDDLVPRLFLVERHFVMQPRTAAFGDLHAQTFPGLVLLRFKQVLQLPNSVLGDTNHCAKDTSRDLLSQKLERELRVHS